MVLISRAIGVSAAHPLQRFDPYRIGQVSLNRILVGNWKQLVEYVFLLTC